VPEPGKKYGAKRWSIYDLLLVADGFSKLIETPVDRNYMGLRPWKKETKMRNNSFIYSYITQFITIFMNNNNNTYISNE
jgi:hypothetical protein